METSNTSKKRNPQAGLKPGETPRERAQKKLRDTLIWMYLWHTSAPQIVAEMLATSETNWLGKLEKKGYVASVPAPHILLGRAYVLTITGAELAAAFLGRTLPYKHRRGTLASAYLVHEFAVQRACIPYWNHGLELEPARLLQGESVPDALAWQGSDAIAIEVDRDPKFGPRLERFLVQHVRAIQEGKWVNLRCFLTTKGQAEEYERRLRQPLFDGYFNANKEWTRTTKVDVPHGIEDLMTFEYRPDLLRKLVHQPRGVKA